MKLKTQAGLIGMLSAALTVNAFENGLARTPQMGWNSWNHFGCDISEDTILSTAKSFVSYNLTKYGYECVFPAAFCVLVITPAEKTLIQMSSWTTVGKVPHGTRLLALQSPILIGFPTE
jgi:hypothetical protein